MSDKTFTGIYIDEDLLDEVTGSLKAANCKSRNEFINAAIRHYLVYLRSKKFEDILTPALESVISARIHDTEAKISRALFKQGVEVAMMMNVIAASYNIPKESLEDLRKMCIDEVSRNSGRYTFDDAVRFQKS